MKNLKVKYLKQNIYIFYILNLLNNTNNSTKLQTLDMESLWWVFDHIFSKTIYRRIIPQRGLDKPFSSDSSCEISYTYNPLIMLKISFYLSNILIKKWKKLIAACVYAPKISYFSVIYPENTEQNVCNFHKNCNFENWFSWRVIYTSQN